MAKLIKEVGRLMTEGVYDPHELFNRIYPNSRKHYSTVRMAIHEAKTRIYA